MSFVDNIHRMGLGALIYSTAQIISAIGLLLAESAIYNALLEGTEEVSSVTYVGLILVLISTFLMLYSTRVMRDASTSLSKVVYDLQGLPTGYTLLFVGAVFGLIGAAVSLVNFKAGVGVIGLGGILEFIGLLLIGTRTKNLKRVFIDPGVGPTLILIGALLLLIGIGGILVRLGFLILGLRLKGVAPVNESVVQKIMEDIEKTIEEKGSVNILEYASKNNYPVHTVFEAAYRIAIKKGYKIANGVLMRSLVM